MATAQITITITPAALARVNDEYGQDWDMQGLAQAIASDIQQTTIGEIAGRGLTVTVQKRR